MNTLLRSSPRRLLARGQRRQASTHAEHHEHHEQHYYEGFATPLWRNVALSFLAVCGFYKYAPSPDESVYLTRWMALYTEPREQLLETNAKHTALSKLSSDDSHLLRSAQPQQMRRYRYPMVFEQHTPFSHPVGLGVDTSELAVKRA